ncbi:MAG: hypothetical protein KBF12_07415 [Sebaldella sp.]|nr:hypothetical protein [Sebaldella sp.]
MNKFFYGIVYFLIIIEPLVSGHVKNFVTLPFIIAFLIFLAQTKKQDQYIHYILVVFILTLGSGSLLWNIVIFLSLYYVIGILNKKLPLEYLLKDLVLVFIINLLFMLLVNFPKVSFLDFISLKCIVVITVQTIYSLFYLLILKKAEGLMIDKNEKTNRYR